MVEYCARSDARFLIRVYGSVDLHDPKGSRLRKSYHPVESIPFEGSGSYQGLGYGTPTLLYHAVLATCLQVQLARRYTTLILQSSYSAHHFSQPRPNVLPSLNQTVLGI